MRTNKNIADQKKTQVIRILRRENKILINCKL